MERHYAKYLTVILVFLFVFFMFEILQVNGIYGIYLSPGETDAGMYGALIVFVSFISPFLIGVLIVLVAALLVLIIYNREELFFR